jgi:hypothetical protein
MRWCVEGVDDGVVVEEGVLAAVVDDEGTCPLLSLSEALEV